MADFFYNAKRHCTFSIQRFLYNDCTGYCLQPLNGLVLLHSIAKVFFYNYYLNCFISADCCLTFMILFLMIDSSSKGLVVSFGTCCKLLVDDC